MYPYNYKMGQKIRTDAVIAIDHAFLAHFQVLADDAVATSANGVAAYNLGVATQEKITGITNPAVPRALSIVGNVAGITGNVVIKGTNYANEAITETLALNGTATVNGNKAFMTVTEVDLPTQIHTPVEQVETATIVGTVTAGVPQVGTATIAGTITADTGGGNAKITVTATGMTGSPKDISVAVIASDSASTVAGKARTALGLDSAVIALFTVGGTGADVTLTKITASANDATLNIASTNDTCTGLTPEATSANTTAGVAPGTGNATVILTAAGMTGSPITLSVAVVASDAASTVAGKIKTAMGLNANIAAYFTIGGSGADIILTRETAVANDATMNVSTDNGTCTGLTTEASSANTTAGAPYDIVSVGWNDVLGLPYKLLQNTVIPGMTFLANTRETTGPTITVSPTDIESNTIDLDGALNGTVVDAYLLV